jgi:hypothetical protein
MKSVFLPCGGFITRKRLRGMPTESREPEAGSRKPEAGSRKPEAESRKPKAGIAECLSVS